MCILNMERVEMARLLKDALYGLEYIELFKYNNIRDTGKVALPERSFSNVLISKELF